MSAPVIPDAIEASCKAPGLWLVQGRVVRRGVRGGWAIDYRHHFPTLQAAIDWVAENPNDCRCGARDFPSCLCDLTPAQWVATNPDKPVA